VEAAHSSGFGCSGEGFLGSFSAVGVGVATGPSTPFVENENRTQ